MHFDFHFTALKVLWTVTFAAQLVLLIVLLGRDRIKRYPIFTASIAIMTLRLLSSRLLADRMPTIVLNEIFVPLAVVAALVGLLVVFEMARRAFAAAARPLWIVNAIGLLVVATAVVVVWGPWPAWKTVAPDSLLGVLRMGQLGSQKLELLANLLNIELCVLILAFGRAYNAGWRTHTQRIVIGLSAASLAQVVAQIAWQVIAHSAHPQSQAELGKLVTLRDNIFNASGAVIAAVFLWWIVFLWLDAPDSPSAEAQTA
jgi:hypothetical protein